MGEAQEETAAGSTHRPLCRGPCQAQWGRGCRVQRGREGPALGPLSVGGSPAESTCPAQTHRDGGTKPPAGRWAASSLQWSPVSPHLVSLTTVVQTPGMIPTGNSGAEILVLPSLIWGLPLWGSGPVWVAYVDSWPRRACDLPWSRGHDASAEHGVRLSMQVALSRGARSGC